MSTVDVRNKKESIRNVCVISHINHGKSSLVDRLVIAQTDEAERGIGITVKASGISLYYGEAPKGYTGVRGNEYLINLIDTPGHVDFSSEVTAALRITDGALLVVDCIDGVRVQTETVLSQALEEQVRPVLSINKMDGLFLDHVDGEAGYQKLNKVIEVVNALLGARYEDGEDEVLVFPERGTVAFSVGLHGWAFTLQNFAKLYASKFGVDESKMMERLWGENFFDPATRRWTTKNTGSPTCKRGFVLFCYEPIQQIIHTCMSDQKDKLWGLLAKLKVTMKAEEKDLTGTALMKRVMQTWLPASNALLEMIIQHLPSPARAQGYRVDKLYGGPAQDKYATAIRCCSADGPLMLYVSKMMMIPAASGRGCQLLAFGRVFAGTLSTGMKVRVILPGQPEQQSAKVQKVLIWVGNRYDIVEDVPCGNTVAVELDKYISVNATLTNEMEVDAHPIRAMRFIARPILRVAVESNLGNVDLVRGLNLLRKVDPMVDFYDDDETNELIVSGAGALHLDITLKELEDNFMRGAKIICRDPKVPVRETVAKTSSEPGIIRFQSYLFSVEARPLDEGLVEAIDAGRIGPRVDWDVCSRILTEEFGWDRDHANKEKVWFFGPDPNMVVDMCKGVSPKIKKFLQESFEMGVQQGALSKGKMRGICFTLRDVYSRASQTKEVRQTAMSAMEAAISGIHTAQLTAEPRLMEPFYRLVIQAPTDAFNDINGILTDRDGYIYEELVEETARHGMFTFSVFLPGRRFFGFISQLREATSGKAFPLGCDVNHHWKYIV